MSDWILSHETPENGEVVEVFGSLCGKAEWSREKKCWELLENEKFQAQIVWYRKLEEKDSGSPKSS